ncbi:protein of unknown function [[Clostridium] ultunense Esp]|uniref:Uncharacterized protein n=1 Tax=[Clostridium] ultunense Esp TaxID=1288971 RepID=A0A1M4PT99_9FIRM|nr:protein of unknown function [[Clostridium] ultunense Esp]
MFLIVNVINFLILKILNNPFGADSILKKVFYTVWILIVLNMLLSPYNLLLFIESIWLIFYLSIRI